jgi:hypothetical protein
MHKNATVAEWYQQHGKHPVYANPRKSVPLPAGTHPVSLKLPRNGQLIEWAPGPAEPRTTPLEEEVLLGR